MEKDLVTKIKAYPLKIPVAARTKKDFYQNLAANARLQTGLHDHFRQGLERYFPYQTALNAYFTNFNMPPELLAISFVESSFNPKAQSFVGALGIWQFMPKIGRHFLPMNKDMDGRQNPLLATLGALHLLQENFQIFKRWDLAISAYNSGTKHLLLAKKKVQKINHQRQKQFGKKAKLLTPDLATLLQNYDHPHLGFASKNYYSEFLAMQWSLAYREQLFVNLPEKTKDYGVVDAYLTCQKMPWAALKAQHAQIPELNNHIFATAKELAAGTIILSNQPLPAPQFLRVPEDIQRRFRPVRWMKGLQKEKRGCPNSNLATPVIKAEITKEI